MIALKYLFIVFSKKQIIIFWCIFIVYTSTNGVIQGTASIIIFYFLHQMNWRFLAPVAATRDALTERLQSVRDATSLLYNRMMENMGYGQQDRLKGIAEKDAEKEEEPAAAKEEEEEARKKKMMMMMMSDMRRLQK